MAEPAIQQLQPAAAEDHITDGRFAPQPRSCFRGRRRIAAVDLWPSPMWTCASDCTWRSPPFSVTAISVHVFGWVSLRTIAIYVMLLLAAVAVLVLARPDRSDRVVLAGFLWGLLACAGYDTFRLPSIYGIHLWNDFFGGVGGWVIENYSNYLCVVLRR